MLHEIRCGNIHGGIPRYISSPCPTWCSWHLARMSCHTGTAAVLAKRPCSANTPTALPRYLKQLPVPTRNLSLSAESEPADHQGAQQAQPSTTLAPIARGAPFPTQQSCQELQADEYAIQAAFASPCITRRFSGGLFLAACTTILGCYGGSRDDVHAQFQRPPSRVGAVYPLLHIFSPELHNDGSTM